MIPKSGYRFSEKIMPHNAPMKSLLCALVLTLLAGSAGAEPVFPPGSRVGLVPPAGMTASTTLQGFEDRARGAVMAVTELSAQSYARIEQDLGDERMRSGGMEPIARETIETASGPALLVNARQTENGIAMRKWALLALVPNEITVAIVATFPEAAREAYPDAALRAAFASLTIKAKLSTAELLAVLPYRLTELGGFRLVRASPDGTAVLTLGPKDTSLPVEQAYFMVATRGGEPPMANDRDRFAQRTFMTFVNRADLNIVASEPVRIAGAAGHEIIAESRDNHSGDPLMSVQWLIFGSNGFVQMFGVARKDQWSDALARMRTLRDGFTRK
jgi:hypothetical protein